MPYPLWSQISSWLFYNKQKKLSSWFSEMINKHTKTNTNTTPPYQYTIFFLFSLYFIFLFFLLSLLSLPPFLFLAHTTTVLLSGNGDHRRFPLRSLFSQKNDGKRKKHGSWTQKTQQPAKERRQYVRKGL